MTFGTGPQALVDVLADNWQAARAGRTDIPDVPRDATNDPLTGPDAKRARQGTVLLARDRRVVENQHSVHDLVHCYHPQATGIGFEDTGYQSQESIETVQIDIEVTDRKATDGTRTLAETRLVGDREAHAAAGSTDSGGTLGQSSGFTLGGSSGATLGNPTPSKQPYPGLLGEVLWILEQDTRKGLAEWDIARKDVVNLSLGAAGASASVSVELEQIATNTADVVLP